MSSTNEATPISIKIYYVICSFSVAFAATAVTISIIILALTWKVKRRLHTVRHLLMCNTCVASIFYCCVQTIHYVFLIFLPNETSDIGCRCRGYLSYITICGVAYSFLIQGISRLFIFLFSIKYPRLTTLKTHYLMIVIQWLLAVFIPLSTIITDDIYFRPVTLCWVPLKKIVHVIYTFSACYVVPVITVFLIYGSLYYYVKQSTKRTVAPTGLINNFKRDLELLRNIVILLTIYLAGGIPSLLFLLTAKQIFYLIGIVTISLMICIEKVCTILLDRDLLNIIKKLLRKKTRVVPFNNIGIDIKIHGAIPNAPETLKPSPSNKQT